MPTLISDVRYAARRARSRLGFTVIAVLSLALGIGANTAAFSLINAILFHKTPLKSPERVVDIYEARDNRVAGPLSYPDYVDLRNQSRAVFSQLSLSKLSVVSRDMNDHVETVISELVNGDFFPLLGLAPQAGRLLGPDDDVAQGAHPVVVLSDDYWRTAFGADPSVVGRQLRLSGRMYTVVGVAPKAIQGIMPGLTPSLYAPIKMTNQLEPNLRDELAQRGDHGYFARARLADGQSLAAAQATATRFVSEMRRLNPKDWTPQLSLRVIPLSSIAVNPLIDNVVVPAASALMVVVALVLVVACANLASFLLAQARDRQREIAIRLAIGATRRAIVRQLLVESLLLAVIGGAFGLLLATVALRVLLHADLPLPLPINLDVSLDGRVLGFAIATATTAGVLFGLLPALNATRPNVIETIKNENAGERARRRFTMRNGLVVAQTAMSLVLLVTAGLFLRSFAAQSNIDPGFGSAPAGMVWMAIPPDRYPGDRSQALLAEIERRMRGLPNVDAVGVIDNMLLNALDQSSMAVTVDGFQPPPGEPGFDISKAAADSGFFDAAGVRIVSGRGFLSTDRSDAPRVAVINEVMASRFWPGGSAVGRTFRIDTATYRVVGVSHTTKVNSLGEAPRPFMFLALAQSPAPDFMLVARTRGNADQTTVRMLSTLHEMDPTLMVIQAKTMARHLAVMVLPARLGAIAFAAFAGLALVLAMVGIYGVVRYAVARRAREVAIRLALGAAPNSLVRLVMREGLRLVAAGVVIGLVLGLAMSRALQSLLYGARAVEPLAFIGAPALLIAVGVAAAFLPARRASRVDPATTLRSD